jgi:hypothetical protein
MEFLKQNYIFQEMKLVLGCHLIRDYVLLDRKELSPFYFGHDVFCQYEALYKVQNLTQSTLSQLSEYFKGEVAFLFLRLYSQKGRTHLAQDTLTTYL